MANLNATPSTRTRVTSGISWGWLLALGILTAGLGVVGLGMTYTLTIVATFWFGVLAILGGGGQLLDAFHHKGWGAIFWHILIAALYIVAGIVLITMPIKSAFWLTLMIAIVLVVVGVSRIIMAIQMRGLGGIWIGVLLSGIISVVLGVAIYGTVTPPTPEALATPEGQIAWVQSWGWVIGLFVAIELLMEGLTLISIAFAAKALGDTERAPAAA